MEVVIFISANISDAGGTNSKTLKPFRATARDLKVRTQKFLNSLILKHDRAYVNQKTVCAGSVAHPKEGVSGVETPLLELKKQYNFIDINSL